jgi:predicted RNase H-like nuclease (RuvC/YqgF family)
MKLNSPDIDLKNYELTDDAKKAVKVLVNSTLENLLKDVSLQDLVLKKYQNRLDEYMMKQYPDLSNRVNTMSLELKDSINKIEKREKEISLKMKSVVKTETLYEDVYKLRDELKEIKIMVEDFTKKLKKAFS